MKNFNEFRFKDLNCRNSSNKYLTMDRVSKDENKIVVKVANEHLIKTKYGYALILDETHVVFLKEWQVNENYFGNEVLLSREYFISKEWGQHDEFFGGEFTTFEKWLNLAKIQQNENNIVKWEK